jgi:hypothetical protein
MDVHARSTEQSWWLALVVTVIVIAVVIALAWMDASAPPVPGLCEALATGQLDVTQFTEDVVAQFTAMCAG